MRGREKVEAALSKDGSREIPAVICYEGIYVRDHWAQLTTHPWWHAEVPDIPRQVAWRRQVIERTGQDWFHLPLGCSRTERQNYSIEVRPAGVYRVHGSTGREEHLDEPQIGGWSAAREIESVHPDRLAETKEEVDERIPTPPALDLAAWEATGRGDLAAAMLAEFGAELYPMWYVAAPLWCCYRLWGFEGMMTFVARRPDLVAYACGRFLAAGIRTVRIGAALGAAGVWVEDCLTDMIGPTAFEQLNLRYLRPLLEEIRALGLKSIYYFCGSPAGKWEQLCSAGVDALAFEESKKGFLIDIEDVVTRVEGRCTVLGNLDAMSMLGSASEAELRAEIRRQIAAGRRNGSRFIMSIGSPVTPGTPACRVRLYCDLVRELGRIA
jgi:hypothetical protein